MKKYGGGEMMPLQPRPRSRSRQSPRARESPAAPGAEIDNVLDGPGDYSFDASALSAQENSELNARGPGGGPAFTEAEKFFYYEVVKLFTKKNLKRLKILLGYGASSFREKEKMFDLIQLSCGCQRSIMKKEKKNQYIQIVLQNLYEVQDDRGIQGDIDDIIKLHGKAKELKKRNILKTNIIFSNLKTALDNAKSFVETLDNAGKLYFRCYQAKKKNYDEWKREQQIVSKFDSIPEMPTSVSGPIETAVTRRSPMGNTKNRETRPINRRSTRRSTRTRRHPSKPVNSKCGIEMQKFQKSWRSTTTLGGKREIISDALNTLEAMKKGLIKCKPGEIKLFEGDIRSYLDQMRSKRRKTNKRKKDKTNKRKK